MSILVNKVIRTLIQADLVFLAAFGLISPIFAVFITQQIKGGSVEVVGFSAAFYWIIKSILQIPVSKILDKKRGEKDDFYFLIFGTILAAFVPIGYIFSSLPWHVYLLQAIYGAGMAMAFPAWSAIFTRHIDRGKEAFEWGLESTALGFGTGITGAIGGVLVAYFGFNLLFIIVSVLALVGALLPLLIRGEMVSRGDGYMRAPEIKKPPLL
jgi:MFS family permease